MSEPLPTRVGGYRVLRRLAYGGMGEVLLGESDGADGFVKRVVIKRILPQYGSHAEFVTMFRDEARITSQLIHGNIVQVLHFGESEDRYFLVLEYVDGPSLASLLAALRHRSETFDPISTAFVLSELAEALDYAHRKRGPTGRALQVVHRDVSPSNVLISREGQVKLTDFGIAKARARLSPTLEGAGVLKGKLGYMAPESVAEGRVESRSDLFALGAVAWEMLVGKPVFRTGNEAETINRVLGGTVSPPSVERPDVPELLDEVILSLLKRRPEARPSRGRDVVSALAPLLAAAEVSPAESLAKLVTKILPAAEAATRTEAPTPSVRPSARPTVLVVDGSRTMRALLKSMLARRYAVSDAPNMARALELSEELTPAAIICQRSLEDGTGIELCRRVRAHPTGARVAVLIMAAELDLDFEVEAAAAGAQGVIEKTISPPSLISQVRSAIQSAGEGDSNE